MLQQDEPDDYVIATGECHSVKEFLDVSFQCVGISDWSNYVRQDKRFMRPAEVDVLIGDCSKAQKVLNWTSTTSFEKLVKIMVDSDVAHLKNKE